MPRESKKQRNAKQAILQQQVRDEARSLKRPSRDDFARMLLWQMITAAHKQKEPHRALGKLRDSIVEQLERQQFNVRQCEEVFHEIADRYSDGLFPFRPKRHLMTA